MTPEEELSLEERKRQIEREIKLQQSRLATLAAEIRSKHLEQQLKTLPAVLHQDLRRLIKTKKEDRDTVQQYLAKKFEKQLSLSDKQVKAADGYKRPALAINRTVSLMGCLVRSEVLSAERIA